jgi:hypothetical protein
MQRNNIRSSNLDNYTSNFNPATNMNPNPPPRNVNIKAPSNVQDILDRLHNSDDNSTKKTRVVSETNMTSDTENTKRRKKKSIISII